MAKAASLMGCTSRVFLSLFGLSARVPPAAADDELAEEALPRKLAPEASPRRLAPEAPPRRLASYSLTHAAKVGSRHWLSASEAAKLAEIAWKNSTGWGVVPRSRLWVCGNNVVRIITLTDWVFSSSWSGGDGVC